jgi:hypothetical protein
MIVTMPVNVGYDINNDEAGDVHHFSFITAQFVWVAISPYSQNTKEYNIDIYLVLPYLSDAAISSTSSASDNEPRQPSHKLDKHGRQKMMMAWTLLLS